MDDDVSSFIMALEFMYNAVGHSDYQQVVNQIEAYPISDLMKEKLKQRFPKPGCAAPASWNSDTSNEDFVEAFATDPRNPGPLSEFQKHGWMG